MWYYKAGEAVRGPIPESELMIKIRKNVVTSTTLVRKAHEEKWVALKDSGLLDPEKKDNAKTKIGHLQEIEMFTPPEKKDVRELEDLAYEKLIDLKNLQGELNTTFNSLITFFIINLVAALLIIPLSGLPLAPLAIGTLSVAVYIIYAYLITLIWRVIPRSKASMSPIASVIFYIIPIANIVLGPLSYYRLCRDLQKYAGSIGIPKSRQAKPALYLSTFIMYFLIVLITMLSSLIMIPGIYNLSLLLFIALLALLGISLFNIKSAAIFILATNVKNIEEHI